MSLYVICGMWYKNENDSFFDVGFKLGFTFARRMDPDAAAKSFESGKALFLTSSLKNTGRSSTCRSKGIRKTDVMKDYVRSKFDC